MNSTPLLSWHNRFNVLHVEQINDIETKIQDVQKPNPCCKSNWKLDLAKLAGGPKLNILVNN